MPNRLFAGAQSKGNRLTYAL